MLSDNPVWCCTLVVGGIFGLVGAALCGPRLGKYEGGKPVDLPGHDMALVTLGTFMLWFGWFGFNSGSVYLYMDPSIMQTNRVALNTTLCGSTAGLTALGVTAALTGKPLHVWGVVMGLHSFCVLRV